MHNALRAGAIAFLKKPFDDSALLDALDRSNGWRWRMSMEFPIDNGDVQARIRPGPHARGFSADGKY